MSVPDRSKLSKEVEKLLWRYVVATLSSIVLFSFGGMLSGISGCQADDEER